MKKSFSLILCIILIMTFAITSLGLTTVGVQTVKLSKISLSIQQGMTFTLTATITPANATDKKLVFYTANKNIATVDKNGTVKGVKVGKTVITVTSVQNKKAIAKCTVTVMNVLSKKFTIKLIQQGSPSDLVEGNVLQKEIESKFNVKIQYMMEDLQNTQKISLLYQSGDGPDAGFCYAPVSNLYQQKLTRSIPEGYIRQFMPTFSAYLDANPSGWLYLKAPDKKNEYIGLIGVNAGAFQDTFWNFYRLDWLEKLGIKPKADLQEVYPGKGYFCPQSFTLDEHAKILEAFAKKDPDGNGKRDTWGMTGQANQLNNFYSVWESFGVSSYQSYLMFQYVNGKPTCTLVTEKYHDALRYFNKLYKSGAIDPEWIQLDWGKYCEKGATQVGWCNNWNSVATESYPERPPYSWILKNPKGKFLETPSPVGPDGKMNFVMGTYDQFSISYSNCFTTKVSDEKMARIMMIYDYTIQDDPTYMRFRNGPAGIAYTWKGEPWDSDVVWKIQDANIKKQLYEYGAGIFYSVFYSPTYYTVYSPKAISPAKKWLLASLKDNGNPGTRILTTDRDDIFGVSNRAKMQTQYGAEIWKIMKQFYVQAVIGQVDLDKDWDKYVQSLYDAGLQKIIDEQAKGVLTSEYIKGKVVY